MENNIKILFWLYKQRTNKMGQVPLMLRITFNNERIQLSTGFFIAPCIWDQAKNRIKGRGVEALEINQYIETTRVKLMQLYNRSLLDGDIHLKTLISKFLGNDTPQITLLELTEQHLTYIKARIGKEYSKSTFRIYLLTQRRLNSFIKIHYTRKDIRLKDLKLEFIQEFELYLKHTFNNDHNTVVRQCKNLKAMINVAIQKNWMDKNPFTGFKCNYKETDPVFLSQEELDLIRNKSFGNQRLEWVRDLFIFQCYTGLAFADMAKLTPENISLGVDGNKWIFIRRQKTGIRSPIPLLPQAIAVIDKYKENLVEGNRLLPVHSNQKYNSYLHEIAEICGINKPLTSHVGRRTFATTVALANGVPIEIISKILGHTSIRMTQIYAIVTDQKISREMNRLKGILK